MTTLGVCIQDYAPGDRSWWREDTQWIDSFIVEVEDYFGEPMHLPFTLRFVSNDPPPGDDEPWGERRWHMFKEPIIRIWASNNLRVLVHELVHNTGPPVEHPIEWFGEEGGWGPGPISDIVERLYNEHTTQ